MRISDWSSDVCSSDLYRKWSVFMRIWARPNGREQKITLVRKLRHLGYPSWFAELMTNQATTKLSSIISMHEVSSQVAVADSAQVIGHVGQFVGRSMLIEIGSAAGRERVWE